MFNAREEDMKFKRRLKRVIAAGSARKINTVVCEQSFRSQTTTNIMGPACLKQGSEPSCGAGREREGESKGRSSTF